MNPFHMRLFFFYIYLAGFSLGASAQSLWTEAHLNGGMNWSYGRAGAHIYQLPFLTYYAQAGFGSWLTPRFGVGVGMAYYPIGILHGLRITDSVTPYQGSNSLSFAYSHLLQFDIRYRIPQHAARWAGSQLSGGILTAQSSFQPGSSNEGLHIYDNQQLLSEWFESKGTVNRIWALIGRWNYPIWNKGPQQIFFALQLVKGLTPVLTTTRSYYINDPTQLTLGEWTTYGDYLGLGITYQWTYWQRKPKPQSSCP